MNTDITGRAVALVAGVISAAGGLAILLEDVVKGSPFGIKHGITIGIVALAILAGHSVVAAWRARHVMGVLGFTIVLLAATGLVVFKSTGRQAENAYASEASARLLAESRERKLADLENARQHKREADAQVGLEIQGRPDERGRPTVKPGCGNNCEDWKARANDAERYIETLEREIAELGPIKPATPEAENFANLAAIFGADKERVRAASLLIVPFLTTALFEFGAIVGFAFGFRHRPVARTTMATQAMQPRQPSPSETAQTDFYADDIEAAREIIIGGEDDATDGGIGGNPGNRCDPKPGNGGGKRVYSRGEALLDLTRRLASGETIPRQDALAEAWGVHPGTASKWLKRWREDGLAPAPQRVGRCHRLVAA